MIRNPKIISLIFILAIFSFVNSEFNHFAKPTDQLAQTSPGVIEIWHRFFDKKSIKKPVVPEEVPILVSPYDTSNNCTTNKPSFFSRLLDKIRPRRESCSVPESEIYPTSDIFKLNPFLRNSELNAVELNPIMIISDRKRHDFERFVFDKFESDHFILYRMDYHYLPFGDYILQTAESYLQQCFEKLECEINNKKKIYIIYYGEKWQYKLVGPENSGGCYQPSTNAILLYGPNTSDEGYNLDRIEEDLSHEIWHSAFNQKCEAANKKYPSWLNEGLAVLNEGNYRNIIFESFNINKKEGLNVWLLKSEDFTNPKFQEAAYNNSASFTRFLLERFGGSEDRVLDFVFGLINSSDQEIYLKDFGFDGYSDLRRQWLGWELDFVNNRFDKPLSKEEKERTRLEVRDYLELDNERGYSNFYDYLNQSIEGNKEIINDPDQSNFWREKAKIRNEEVERFIQRNFVY